MAMTVRFIFIALMLSLTLFPTKLPAAEASITIKFSHVVAPDTPKGKAALKFKEFAEQRTGGRVKVEVYPNSTLYKDGEEINALLEGSVHVIAPALSKFSPPAITEFEVFDLPFIFPG